MKDILEIFFGDKLKSYFYRTFIFTWIIYNWRIIFVVLFYKNLPQEEINLGIIEAVIANSGNFCNLFFIPFVLSILLIFILPKIDLIISKYKEKTIRSKYLRDIRYNPETLYSGKEMQRKDNEIEEVKKKLVLAESDITSIRENYQKILDDYKSYTNKFQFSEDFNKNLNNVFGSSIWDFIIDNEVKLSFSIDNSSFRNKSNFNGNDKIIFNVVLYKFNQGVLEMVLKINDFELFKIIDNSIYENEFRHIYIYLEKKDELYFSGFLRKLTSLNNEINSIGFDLKKKYNN